MLGRRHEFVSTRRRCGAGAIATENPRLDQEDEEEGVRSRRRRRREQCHVERS
jgi:hypothetical protein